ncbi:MAG: leucyl/phenylalanyl-tRNA--protein transferase [Aquimonas sp.]|nr:leucyl/phenylalanyl-tRNA--protein transferase [Aquimonas sp.]
MSLRLPELGASPDAPFPPPERALHEPNGLLAWGGGLEPGRLLRAYAQGIFPWFSAGEPPLWWSPDPRMVLDPAALSFGSRDRRRLCALPWRVRADHDFAAVIDHCAQLPRAGQRGTWILPAMRRAYLDLHHQGYAHSIEVLDAEGRLVGGLYGLALGRAFFGESMFSVASGGSKLALAGLCQRMQAWDMPLLDGQVESAHLQRLGFRALSRDDFLRRLGDLTAAPEPRAGSWKDRFGELPAALAAAD